MKPITKSEITEAFSRVGLKTGSIVMVHTSLGKIGYVCGGAQTVIEALIEIVGADEIKVDIVTIAHMVSISRNFGQNLSPHRRDLTKLKNHIIETAIR